MVMSLHDWNKIDNLQLVKDSLRKRTNLYTIVDKTVRIDISVNNDGSKLLFINLRKFNLVEGLLWRERFDRAFTTMDSKRVYIEEVIFPKRTVTGYKDDNKLNNTYKNLIFM